MYIPPFQALLSIMSEGARNQRAKTIAVPEPILKLILRLALQEGSDFDESAYLRENPDVAESVRRGAIPSAKHHYVNYGYLEGRKGAIPVDAAWYEKQYPDVSQAIRTGKAKVKSAMEHFQVAGAAEGRAPNAASQAAALAWTNAMGNPK